METQTLSDKIQKAHTANIVAMIVVCGCFSFLFVLLFKEIPSQNRDIVNFLSGSLFATLLNAIAFFLYNYRKKDDPITDPNATVTTIQVTDVKPKEETPL
jgi:Na+-transporting NADH:ubiquinone oxidoreductase subunit NqrD